MILLRNLLILKSLKNILSSVDLFYMAIGGVCMANSPVLNIEGTLERISNDADRLKDLYIISFEEFPKWKLKMKEVIESGDFEKIRKVAHTYKGSSATIGAELARECFLEIENAAKDENLNLMNDLYDKAFNAVDSAEAAMKEFLEK